MRWLPGGLASCFHAVAALLFEQPLAEPALAEALRAPAESLRAALADERIAPASFLAHLIPLTVGTGSLHQLAEVALIKILGRARATPRVSRFGGLLSDLIAAFSSVLPHCAERLTALLPALQGLWHAEGIGILGGIVSGTEPGVLVSEATIVGIHPALGGGGTAYLPYNVACIEAVAVDPITDLPEIVRLAWLVSMLNLDLPIYSEHIHADRQYLVAGMAMIPIALTAAEGVGLARCAELTVSKAVEAWMPPWLVRERPAPEWAALLIQWHATYRTMRPALGTALKALDVLMREEAR
jgi:hypothetical protein